MRQTLVNQGLERIWRENAIFQLPPKPCRIIADRERRTRFMAEANRAYEAGNAEALKRILDEYEDGAEAVMGEGIGAELIRIIRQISMAKTRLGERMARRRWWTRRP